MWINFLALKQKFAYVHACVYMCARQCACSSQLYASLSLLRSLSLSVWMCLSVSIHVFICFHCMRRRVQLTLNIITAQLYVMFIKFVFFFHIIFSKRRNIEWKNNRFVVLPCTLHFCILYLLCLNSTMYFSVHISKTACCAVLPVCILYRCIARNPSKIKKKNEFKIDKC